MILKKPFLLLITLFSTFSASAQADDQKNNPDLSQLPTSQLVLRLFEYELADEISPYHYIRLEFLKHDYILNREGTVEYTDLEDKLIDDVEDAAQDVGEELLKLWIKNWGIGDWTRDHTDQRLRFDVYYQDNRDVGASNKLTLDAGMALDNPVPEKSSPIDMGFRIHGLNDGPGLYLKWKQAAGYNGQIPKHDLSVYPMGHKIEYYASSFFGGPKIKAMYDWKDEELKIRANDIMVREDQYITFGATYNFSSDDWGIGILFFGRF